MCVVAYATAVVVVAVVSSTNKKRAFYIFVYFSLAIRMMGGWLVGFFNTAFMLIIHF